MRIPSSHRGGFIISLIVACTMTVIGLAAALLIGSQVILLDGMFNAVYAIAATLTLYVSRLVNRPSDLEFPYGYRAFVPLVNLTKSLLIAGVSLFAVWGALVTLFTGGNDMEFNAGLIYGALSMLICGTGALLVHHFYKKDKNELLRGDLVNWSISAAISAGLAISFAIGLGLQSLGYETVARYVDSVLVTAVVMGTIGLPYAVGKGALSELLARAPGSRQRKPIEEVVRHTLGTFSAQRYQTRMIKVAHRR